MLLGSDLPQMPLSAAHLVCAARGCCRASGAASVTLPEALLAPDNPVLEDKPEVGLLLQVYKHLWPYWSSWGTCQWFYPGQGSYSA